MTPQDWLPFIFSVVKTVVWAAAVVIGARITLPRVLANRALQFKGKGVDVTVAAEEQRQAIAQPPDRQALLAANPLPPPPREAIRFLEEGFVRELEGIPPANRQAVLVRALSTARLFGQHAATYNVIFGSQIEGLNPIRASLVRSRNSPAAAIIYVIACIPSSLGDGLSSI